MAKIKSLVLHLTTAQCFDHGDELSAPQGEGKVHADLFYMLVQSQQICRLENTEDYLKKVSFSLNKSKQVQRNERLFSPPTMRRFAVLEEGSGASFAKSYDEELHVIGTSHL